MGRLDEWRGAHRHRTGAKQSLTCMLEPANKKGSHGFASPDVHPSTSKRMEAHGSARKPSAPVNGVYLLRYPIC
jgi:hypothetical protein